MRHRIASREDVPDDGGIAVDIGAKRVALFRYRGSFYALDETCPHRGGPLHSGPIEAGVVRCPWHHWQFELESGCSPLNPLSRVGTYPVYVEGDDLWVELPDGEAVEKGMAR